MRRIVLLGSTGSIGRNVLDIVDRYPDRLALIGLASGGNVESLVAQVVRYRPRYAAIADQAKAWALRQACGDFAEIYSGAEGISYLAAVSDADIVVNAISGVAGLGATISALEAGKRLALANKESMVAAGPWLWPVCERSGAEIVPIDSEHSAVFQCLKAGRLGEVARIILTSSGGPFLDRSNLDNVTVAEALAHPVWSMGQKTTIDSATLMNKALEIIEAAHMFRIPKEKIEVVIHPQSVVHSLVEFIDGASVAQLSLPDMRLPIQYAIFYPERVSLDVCRIDYTRGFNLEFRPVDRQKFPAIDLAYSALSISDSGPAVLNAADEVAVNAFLSGRLRFTQICQVVRQTLEACAHQKIAELPDVLKVTAAAADEANRIVDEIGKKN